MSSQPQTEGGAPAPCLTLFCSQVDDIEGIPECCRSCHADEWDEVGMCDFGPRGFEVCCVRGCWLSDHPDLAQRKLDAQRELAYEGD